MFVKKMDRTKAIVIFFFVLSTYIIIKIVDEYRIVDEYYCMIMESLD